MRVGYPAVLVMLDRITVEALEELIVEAWLAQAPKRVAAAFLRGRDQSAAPPDAAT